MTYIVSGGALNSTHPAASNCLPHNRRQNQLVVSQVTDC